MTIVEMLRTWGGLQDAFETIQVDSDDTDSLSARLRTTERAAMRGLELNVQKLAGDDRIWLSFRQSIPDDVMLVMSGAAEVGEMLGAFISSIDDARSGLVTCVLHDEGAVFSVEIRAVIYLDGFSRHNLNFAVLEIAKACHAIEQRYVGLVGSAQILASTQQLIREEEQRTEQLLARSPETSGPSIEKSDSGYKEQTVTSPDSPATSPTAEFTCPACHAPNQTDSRFCSQCGGPFPCASCGASNSASSRFCKKCGASLRP